MGGSQAQLCAATDEKLVFLHVPKCGGTTLHDLLQQWYGAAAFHPERHNGLYQTSIAELASKQVFSGHFDFYSTRFIPGPRRLISFLRQPRARLLSLYHFHRAHSAEVIRAQNLTLAKLAHEHDINAYFASPEVRAHPGINNSMSRYLSDVPQLPGQPDVPVARMRDQALRNFERFDFIGFVETYEASTAALAQLLNKPCPRQIKRLQDLKTVARSNPHMREIENQKISPETEALMTDLVQYDEAIYNAACARFAPSVSKQTA